MPKKITPGFPIYVAHQMLGEYVDRPVVTDERTKETLDPERPEDKIRIYQRQVSEWFLSPARMLFGRMREQASFAILAICLPYIEGVQQYREGESSNQNSKVFFQKSFQRIFASCNLSQTFVDVLYEQARCGLFHDGMTRSQVVYDMNINQAFEIQCHGSESLIHFHPGYLLDCIEKDFTDYIKSLTDDENARGNFDRMYELL